MLFLGKDDDDNAIGIETEKHAITVASARTGKGAAVIIPNLLRWHENLLCIDPAGENVAATWKVLEERGLRVGVLDPFREAKVPDRLRVSCDLLGSIDPASPMAREQVRAIADGCVLRPNAEHGEWYDAAVTMIAGVAAYVRTAPEWTGPRDLLSVRALLTQTDVVLQTIFEKMEETDDLGRLAKAAGTMGLVGLKSDKGIERGGISGARTATEWMDAEAMQNALGASSFKLSELKTGRAALFLVLPIDMIQDYARFLRLFVRCSLSAMQRGGKDGRRCLFVLDEFYALGRMDAVATAIGALPKNGVHIWPFLQDINQLLTIYGPQLSHTFFANADVEMFFGATDTPTLEYISQRLGTLTQQEVVDLPPKTAHVKKDYTKTGYTEQDYAWGFWSDPTQVDRDRVAAQSENKRRRQAADDENRRRQQEAEDETERRRVAAEDEYRQRLYQHQMRSVGQPRLTPLEIKELTAKRDGDKVARSMIVFGKGGDVFNLRLAPYFEPLRPRQSSRNEQSENSSKSTWMLISEDSERVKFRRGNIYLIGLKAAYLRRVEEEIRKEQAADEKLIMKGKLSYEVSSVHMQNWGCITRALADIEQNNLKYVFVGQNTVENVGGKSMLRWASLSPRSIDNLTEETIRLYGRSGPI